MDSTLETLALVLEEDEWIFVRYTPPIAFVYKMIHVYRILVLLMAGITTSACCLPWHSVNGKRDISPLDFGLEEAKTGIERYNVLLMTHQMAVKTGVNVSYIGIDTIKIEIPRNSKSIPLTQYNDFRGCVFVVKNTSNNCWLFDSTVKGESAAVSKQMIDEGYFRSHEVLRRGRYLLLVEDKNPWVLNRKGYDYGHQRKDILLIENGVAKNQVVMPYNNAYSSPKCIFIKLNNQSFVFKNLIVERDPDCTFLTHIASIVGHDNVRVQAITVHTPPSDLVNDRGIMINDCTNVTLEDVSIDGTYSKYDHSGYGICLDNIWNFKATRLYGKGNWGIFGNNNINTAKLVDSQLNRFDIHCYGKDISFRNVAFFDLYNQYASVYGTIRYDKCTFTEFVPVRNSGSYNAYVAHNVVLNDCVLYANPSRNFLFKLLNLNEPTNERHELAEKCLPNISINNLMVNLRDGADSFYIFSCSYSGQKITDIGYLSKINIEGLVINSDENKPVKDLMLSNITIQTKSEIDCQMRDVIVKQPVLARTKAVANEEATVVLKTNMPLRGGKVVLQNVAGIRQ